MFDFTNQVVIVTGSTGNLGGAVARAFMEAGAKLVLVDRSVGKLPELFPELANSPDHFLAEGVDLTNAPDVQRMADQAAERFGRIDALVNTAGGYRGGKPLHETSLETWDFLLNLNARTILIACQAVIPQMLRQGSGKIVNISARAALSGAANQGPYSASKIASVRLTEAMAAELRNSGINVNCILPGTIDTPQNRAERAGADFSRWVPPEAIADVILFLASPAARAIHGASVPVYGLS
jgi:NAD(P)-dependent dehydrogenase (short-subunit alcohol dehydrogenase family)